MHLVVLDNGQIRMTHDLEWGRARVKREVLISERLLSVAALYVACERSIARLPPSFLLVTRDRYLGLTFPLCRANRSRYSQQELDSCTIITLISRLSLPFVKNLSFTFILGSIATGTC